MRTRLIATACIVGACLIGASPAPAQSVAVQPGASIESEGSYCTLAWILDGPGGPYATTAAHCVSGPGAVVNLATGALGSVIERFGTVAYAGNPAEAGRDYALIRIDADDIAKINPALKGWPAIPTGMSTRATAAQGDLMQFSGHGVGFSLTQPTREQRKGVLNFMDDREHLVLGVVVSGDSGGPVADITDGNKAFGLVNTVGVAINGGALTVVNLGEGGVNLQNVIADAAAHCFGGLTVRTVGTSVLGRQAAAGPRAACA